jgi:hypothetical protein
VGESQLIDSSSRWRHSNVQQLYGHSISKNAREKYPDSGKVNLSHLSDGKVEKGIETKREGIDVLMRECTGVKTVWPLMYFMGNIARGEEGRERVIETLLELFKGFKGKKGRVRLIGRAKEQRKGLLMECQERRDRERRMEEETAGMWGRGRGSCEYCE